MFLPFYYLNVKTQHSTSQTLFYPSDQQLFEECMKINLKQLFSLMLTESINQGGYDPENYVKLNE